MFPNNDPYERNSSDCYSLILNEAVISLNFRARHYVRFFYQFVISKWLPNKSEDSDNK